MRIGMPTTSYPSAPGDGAGRFVRELARALVGRGHSVEVLAPELHDRHGDPGDHGIDVRRIAYLRPRALERTFGRHGAPDNLRLDPLAWPGALTFPLALAREVTKRHRAWDAVISHWAIPSALAVTLAAVRTPHVAVLHGSDVHLARALPRAVRETIARSGATLCFVSADLRDRFLRGTRGAQRVFVQPMGIDAHETEGRDRTVARARWGLTRTTALTMSRLVPIKGIERAILAVSRLDDVELLVAGEGPERAALGALAERLRAPVRFVGHVTAEARVDLLAGSDLLLAPSRTLRSDRTEGTPTSVLEALAAGLPVIASRAGGIAEVVEHERTGLLSDGTAEALARDLTRLLSDGPLRVAMSAEARVAGGAFHVDRVAERLERCLRHGSIGVAPAGTSSANAESGIAAG